MYVYTAGRTPWTGDRPVVRPLPARRKTQTTMSIVGFEREKTVHASDSAPSVIGHAGCYLGELRTRRGED
jgi:hypothetical protein